MKLNEKIQHYRRRAGMSQETLAEKLGVSRQAVSKWETGDAMPEISNLLMMAKVFGVTTDHLLSEEDPDNFLGQEENADSKGKEKDSFYIMGKLGMIVRKFGWISGVYIALSGVPFMIFGFLLRMFAKRSMDVMDGFGNMGGNFFIGSDPTGTFASNAESMISSPMVTMSTVIIAVGAVIIVFGVILALYLKRKFGK